MSLSGDLSSLKKFSAGLRRLPTVVAQKVARSAAPEITSAAQATFAAGEDPYGAAWAPGAEGQTVTLQKSGSLRRYISYVAIGTILRVALGVPYAKYQIGKRPVFPRQGAPLPPSYVRTLKATTGVVCRAELGTS